jgi:hypothetical protein
MFTVHYSHDGTEEQEQEKQQESSTATTKTTQEDRHLPKHTDASLYTFNINLNFEDEYDPDRPAQLLFYDPDTNHAQTVTMKPGMAVVHRGLYNHQALPLKKSKGGRRRRDQLIVWLFGRESGEYHVRAMPYKEEEQMSVGQRWTKINNTLMQRQQHWTEKKDDDDNNNNNNSIDNDFLTDWL